MRTCGRRCWRGIIYASTPGAASNRKKARARPRERSSRPSASASCATPRRRAGRHDPGSGDAAPPRAAELPRADRRDRARSRCCATAQRTCWRPPCDGCGRMRRSASGRPSRTDSTTTSRSSEPFTPDDLAAFEPRCARWCGEVSVRARGSRPRAPAALFADDPLKLERLVRAGRRRGDLHLHRRAVRRPLPRAARSGHVARQALQAAAHRRRILARRREAADAAAHLRHGVVEEGGSRGVPPPARGGEAARPPRAGTGSSTSSPPTSASVPGSSSGTRAARSCARRSRTSSAS
jgi:hypothetical protein